MPKRNPTNDRRELQEALHRLAFQGFCVLSLVLGLFLPSFFLSVFGMRVGEPLEAGEVGAGESGERWGRLRQVAFAAHWRSPEHPRPALCTLLRNQLRALLQARSLPLSVTHGAPSPCRVTLQPVSSSNDATQHLRTPLARDL